ncbi:MAG TPA: cytochrome c family protein [Burkholderiales bacterium]|nr:cytochrome c family protein [Burkholderiales bacterium]
MNFKALWCVLLVAGFQLLGLDVTYASGDAARGARVFRACAACHSVTPGEHMTGPSLAHVWNRKAGTIEDFLRYSDAVKKANLVWTEANLDKWLANPQGFLPGTSMTFAGIREEKDRRDAIAYLKSVSEGNASAGARQGMMGGKPNLKKAPLKGQVTAIEHCRDTYTVKTAEGKVNKIWEFNLRFKTDSSKDGPAVGKPVIVGAGMQGDRASVIFASPAEISGFIKQSCR